MTGPHALRAWLSGDNVLSVKNAVRSAAVILVGVIAFQIAIAFGAPWGAYTQGGKHVGALPAQGRIIAAVSVVLLVAMLLSLFARIGRGPLKRLPRRRLRILYWFTLLYSALAVVLNLITKSTHERGVWLPVSIVLLALVVFILRRTRFHHFL
jgi:hypothetical protein